MKMGKLLIVKKLEAILLSMNDSCIFSTTQLFSLQSLGKFGEKISKTTVRFSQT